MAKRKLRVAVVGDFMKDIYHIGEAVGLSAEVPIPVVKVRKTLCFPGGAGNVARNLGELGVETLWFGGGGEPVKHRLMVGDHQIARWDENDVCTPVMGLERLREVDAIVVADYGKGSIDKYTIEAIRKTQGIPVFVDTKRDPSVWSDIATAIFPNEKEYDDWCKEYRAFDGVVVKKRGALGLELCASGFGEFTTTGEFSISPSVARKVVCVNGAGDTVMAAFVYKWLMDAPKQDCQVLLGWANTAAAIAVEHPMTYAPTLEEIEARYYRNE